MKGLSLLVCVGSFWWVYGSLTSRAGPEGPEENAGVDGLHFEKELYALFPFYLIMTKFPLDYFKMLVIGKEYMKVNIISVHMDIFP